jgi:hypothetical protein
LKLVGGDGLLVDLQGVTSEAVGSIQFLDGRYRTSLRYPTFGVGDAWCGFERSDNMLSLEEHRRYFENIWSPTGLGLIKM